MFKNMKLSAKMSFGFGTLIIIAAVLGIVSWLGLSSITSTVGLSTVSNTCLDQVNQCAKFRRDFAINGFKKAADGKNAVDNWNNAYSTLTASLTTLSQSSSIAKQEKDLASKCLADSPAYKKAFDEQLDSQRMRDEAFAAWGKTGAKITAGIDKAVADVIAPASKAAMLTKDANMTAHWASVSDSLNDLVVNKFMNLRVAAVYLLATSSDEALQSYQEKLTAANTGIDQWGVSVKGDAKLEPLAAGFAQDIHEYENAGLNFQKGMQAQTAADKAMAAAAKNIVDSINSLQAGLENTMESQTASTNFIMITVAVSGIVLGIILAIIITRGIVRPITAIIAGLTEGSQQVASASTQVSSSSQSLAEGATEQAAGLEETSSSLEEMSSMTKQTADNAKQAAALATESKVAASNGSQSMAKMNAAINDIQKSSSETAKIIKVIDEIAFQTNLLALNAAVEAARAGEAGKGFAVVAEEVRNLAMRSAEAAKNTASMIEQSVSNAKNGVDITNEVTSVLDEIVTSVGKTADLIGEIAASSQEQAKGIDQVNVAVAQMDKVTQSNAANAEESASASEELNAQAEQMNTIVGELVALVGGSSANTAAPKFTQHKTKKDIGLSDHLFHDIAAAKTNAPRAKTHRADAVATKKSIPLTDNELNHFNN